MACFQPLKAYKAVDGGITFNPHRALIEGSSIVVPCGGCIGCRLEKAQEWATRCMHEAQMHQVNSFITLTYSDQAVPIDYSVKLRDWQLFMKRLRKYYTGTTIRYFACGEYGDKFLRPHYHALLFGMDFPDKIFVRKTKRGDRIYTSETLQFLWPAGSHEIGTVTYKSAGYVARYQMKKIGGDSADDHYSRVSPIDGQTYRVDPEFAVMSRRPGLGTTWYEKYKDDAFKFTHSKEGRIVDGSEFLVIDGRKVKPPQFYVNKLEEDYQKKLKRLRVLFSNRNKEDRTKARLAIREEIQLLRAKRLHRQMES